MFGQLVNYLLGTTTTTTTNTTRTDQPSNPSTPEPDRIRPLVLEEDDGWLLVDRDSEGNSVGSPSTIDDLEDADLDLDVVDNDDDGDNQELDRLAIPAEMTRSAASSSSSSHAAMEESWYITPPPCFTSTGTVVMETSPLENLLIEHPSISVYRHHPNPQHPHFRILNQQLQERSSEAEDEDDIDVVNIDLDEFVEIEDRLLWREQARRRRMRHVDDVLKQQDVQRVRTKSAQRVQIQKACQTLKKGYLERTNKARDVNCRNQRQRRGEKSQGSKRSCANNNRKC